MRFFLTFFLELLFYYNKSIIFVETNRENMENETHKLASELTEQQIENILSSWEGKKELQDFNCLVRLGDSKSLAISTILVDKANKVDHYDFNYNAYNN